MKKKLLTVVALLAFIAAGCKDKPKEMPSAAVPQTAPGQNNILTPQLLAAVGHKGRVVNIMDGGAYTFMQVEENGQKIWVGVKRTKINVGDEVEFPASPSVEQFKSKALNRTFDKVYFVSNLKVNGK